MRAPIIPAILLSSALIALPGAAYAQEDGVFLDPDTPSGKEYVIPVEEARREAGDPVAPGKDAEPFGVGIRARGESGANGSPDPVREEAGANSTGSRADSDRAASISPADTDGDSDESPFMLAAGVLAVGIGSGVLLRRRRPS